MYKWKTLYWEKKLYHFSKEFIIKINKNTIRTPDIDAF